MASMSLYQACIRSSYLEGGGQKEAPGRRAEAFQDWFGSWSPHHTPSLGRNTGHGGRGQWTGWEWETPPALTDALSEVGVELIGEEGLGQLSEVEL